MFTIIYIMLSLVSIVVGCYVLANGMHITKTAVTIYPFSFWISLALFIVGSALLGFAIHNALMSRAMKVVSIKPRKYIKVRR